MVALGIDEGVLRRRRIRSGELLGALVLEVEELRVRGQENVGRDGLESGEGSHEVVGDARVGGLLPVLPLDEDHARQHRQTADRHRAVALSSLLDHEIPRGTAPGVAGGDARRHRHPAQGDRFAIRQLLVDEDHREEGLVAQEIVIAAATLESRGVQLAGHEARTARLLQSGQSTGVVEMGVAVEQQADVFHLEAQRLDTRPDQRHGLLESTVDQDVAVGGGDQEGSDAAGAHVVEVAEDAEGLHRLIHGLPALRQLGPARKREHERQKEEEEHARVRSHGPIVARAVRRCLRRNDGPAGSTKDY